MRNLIVFLTLTSSLLAVANEITITPGSSVIVSPSQQKTKVVCEAEDSSAKAVCDKTVGTGNCDGLTVGQSCTYFKPGLIETAGVCVQSSVHADGERWCSCGPK